MALQAGFTHSDERWCVASQTSEDLENAEALTHLYIIMKSAIMLNDTNLLEHLLSEENVMDVVSSSARGMMPSLCFSQDSGVGGHEGSAGTAPMGLDWVFPAWQDVHVGPGYLQIVTGY